MTTLSEYKAMPVNTQVILNSDFVLELIRVIELAEEALQSCGDTGEEQYYTNGLVNEALSEIRKLRGE